MNKAQPSARKFLLHETLSHNNNIESLYSMHQKKLERKKFYTMRNILSCN